jgi:CubicO group peptidase (beta-lactamase class C family)
MSEFTAYHGVDSAEHQRRFDELSEGGLRPAVYAVSGDPANPRYAAVWVRRAGPPWWAFHGLSAADYQDRVDELSDQGFGPTMVSAVGPFGGEVFAAVFEQRPDEPWFAGHGLRWGDDTDPQALQFHNRRAAEQGYAPQCLAVYGSPSDRRFAGVWRQNPGADLWSWWWTEEDAYQRFFTALKTGGLRPAALAVAADRRVLAVFRGDRVGPWHARHAIGAVEYQREFDAQAAAGRRPIVVATGGRDESARYAAVFAADDSPAARVWNAVGGAFAGVGDLDGAIRAFMVRLGIRAGAVAVGRGGTIVAARGYTWAEPDYPVTRPETRFRIASVSKAFTAAAVAGLVAAGRLAWDTEAFPFVGVTSPLPSGVTPDPASEAITVEQLVLRTSRLPRDFDREQREIAARLGHTAAPLPRETLIRYLYGLPLIAAVPSGGAYSNTAFYLLTAVVERAAGLPYAAALDRYVLRGLEIGDVAVGATEAGAALPGEVAGYDCADLHGSQLDFAADALAPNAYGGDYVLETGAGSGGLVTSAPSIARLIAHHPVWNADRAHLTGREVGTRYGTLEGSSSGARSRRDGLDFAFLFNRRFTDAQHDEIRDAIDAVLTAHGGSL